MASGNISDEKKYTVWSDVTEDSDNDVVGVSDQCLVSERVSLCNLSSLMIV